MEGLKLWQAAQEQAAAAAMAKAVMVKAAPWGLAVSEGLAPA